MNHNVAVIDASIAISWFSDDVSSTHTKKILDLAEDHHLKFIAPPLFLTEVSNILLVKKKFEVEDILSVLQNMLPSILTIAPLELEETIYSIKLAKEWNLTIYDASYLAVAITQGIPLITNDSTLLNVTEHCLSTDEFLKKWQ
jgi:predicted nucleic acid-binding protein